jgi:signal recognition particle GTPase
VQDVNSLLKQYSQTRKMMKSFAGGGMLSKKLAKMMPNLPGMFNAGQ